MEQHHYPDFTGEDTDTMGGGSTGRSSSLIPISRDPSHTTDSWPSGDIIHKTPSKEATPDLHNPWPSEYSRQSPKRYQGRLETSLTQMHRQGPREQMTHLTKRWSIRDSDGHISNRSPKPWIFTNRLFLNNPFITRVVGLKWHPLPRIKSRKQCL